MPKQYEAIRDKFVGKGMPLAEAKTHAAKIYNSTHHSNPVTNNMSYSKGGDIRPNAYAAGGPVLNKSNSQFLKTPDDFRDEGLKNDENFAKKGKGAQGKDKVTTIPKK